VILFSGTRSSGRGTSCRCRTTRPHKCPVTGAKGLPLNKHFVLVFVRDDVVTVVDRDVVALLRAKFEAVLPHLDERQQRLVMAGEARSASPISTCTPP